MELAHLSNFIAGDFKAPISGKYFESYNPATGQVIHMIPDSTADDVEAAVAAAKSAFPAWSKTSREHRSQLLNRLADLIESRLQQFAEAESRDQGKTVKQALVVEIPRAVKNFRYFASAALHLEDQASTMDGLQSFTQRSPVGIVGLISPWNLPLYLLTWKIAPALAMGNCVVAKPSELTSLTAYLLCELIKEAGFPSGVVNIVFGYGHKAGEAIVRHPDVSAISFTGGTVTGRKIQAMAAEGNKKVSLELGGKNANIIFADCDKEATLSTSIRSSFTNQGEICLCGSRILVERPYYEEFLKVFTEAAENLAVGDPSDPNSFMGALVSSEHLAKVNSYIEIAVSEGCRILTGASAPKVSAKFQNGYFLRPTVIADVNLDSRLMKEEIFGPIVCVVPFDTIDEAVAIANDTEYGLSATVWSTDLRKAQNVAASLQVGTVWINCWMVRDLNMPFGGVKSSGVGREGGNHSLDFFSELKTISIAL